MEPEKYVELNVFVKLKGFATTGGQAKLFIREGKCKVNGVVDKRNKKKLHEGDKITIEDKEFSVEKEMLKQSRKQE